jgi:hypothetical protein
MYSHHLKKNYLKCFFANILLISFIFNIKFMFCTCIIVVDLIFIYFRFCSFHIEICNITSKFEFPPLVSMKTISFGSAKNIGKKEKYYLKKYLYIIKNFQTSIMIQILTMKSKLLLNSKSVRINKLCTDFISNLLKIRKDSIS